MKIVHLKWQNRCVVLTFTVMQESGRILNIFNQTGVGVEEEKNDADLSGV